MRSYCIKISPWNIPNVAPLVTKGGEVLAPLCYEDVSLIQTADQLDGPSEPLPPWQLHVLGEAVGFHGSLFRSAPFRHLRRTPNIL